MIEFPQFRKYSHGKTWYMIQSFERFTELCVMGSRFFLQEFEAKQYPEKLRITDMLQCKDEIWLKVTEEEYMTFLNNCKSHLQRGS